MDIQPQYGMVFNLDKCLGCNTCTVACKNLWTNREGAEYMFWNNVETKPGIGYPKEWENQDRYQGGWEVTESLNPFSDDRSLRLRTGSRLSEVLNIFYNPVLPEMDDYYGEDPYTYTYEDLHTGEKKAQQPVARPQSMITGEEDIEITWNANWEDNAGGAPETGWLDGNFEDITDAEREALLSYEDAFMFYLPRICNHCSNPSCVASCPSGAAYKREEDGIVLIDQDDCRSWRYCVSSCPYKKPYTNWRSAKMEKCILCYPRLEEGEAPACFHSCVGRIRYIGPLLIDRDSIESAAMVPEEELVDAQRDVILDPADPSVREAALEQGVPRQWVEAARRSPAYTMFVDWKIALPLHPEFRTLPMLFYVPPESPMRTVLEADDTLSMADGDDLTHLPDLGQYRIPLAYLASMFAAGNTDEVERALEKQIALRIHRRSLELDDEPNITVLEEADITVEEATEMHSLLSIADYDDRFVIPKKASEDSGIDPFVARGQAGFDVSGAPGQRGIFHQGHVKGPEEGGD